METKISSLDSVLKNRTVIPRWKPPGQAVETSSFTSAQLLKRKAAGTSWLRHLTSSFEQLPSPYTANELYETALMYGRVDDLSEDVLRLSKQLRTVQRLPLLDQNSIVSGQPLLLLGSSVDVHEDVARTAIHKLRNLVRDDPARAFCWSELARHYLVVGQQEKAVMCMTAALQLSKRNRYLYRAATRLYVHVHEPDRALDLLRSHPLASGDPWLVAAEIATSSVAKKRSRLIDTAKRLLGSNQFSQKQISELAAAMGTVELENGSTKHAKALFNRSLIDPTENALAQGQWAVEQDVKIIIPTSAWQTAASNEAKAMASRQERNWVNSIQACAAWLADEPFSTRPAFMGSYISFRPEYCATAEQFASAGLRSDPNNVQLLNNRAVARAYQGKLTDAYTDVKLALEHSPAREDAHVIATLGLIAFRSAMPELGREYYHSSIAWFLQSKDKASAASALLHLMREEIRIDEAAIPKAKQLIKQIVDLPSSAKSPELLEMADIVFDEASNRNNSDSQKSDLPLIAPASREEFSSQASLFHVPEKAKSQILSFSDYSKVV